MIPYSYDGVKCNVLCFPAHSLPMFRESQSRNLKRKREKERLDPVLSHNPEPPISKSKLTLLCVLTYQIVVSARHELLSSTKFFAVLSVSNNTPSSGIIEIQNS